MLAQLLPAWFPTAFEPDVGPLPADPQLTHLFAGLVMLADWLGSDTRLFPFCGENGRPGPEYDPMPFARDAARRAVQAIGLAQGDLQGQPLPDFATQFPFAPNPIQAMVEDLALPEEGSLTILEAETGSGKTEAALRLFSRLFHAGRVDALYFACPLRFAATQLHGRIHACLRRSYPEPPPVVLAVPGYLRVDEATGYRLPGYEVLWNDAQEWTQRTRGWASEHPKRFLTARVAVGTIDQALLAGMRVGHAHLRAAGLARSLLVIDEVHASDAYMTRLTENLLCFLRGVGGHVLLMSATLGGAVRQRYLDIWQGQTTRSRAPDLQSCIAAPYPVVWTDSHSPRQPVDDASKPARRVHLRFTPMDSSRIAELAADLARQGACVLVLRNKVATAMETATWIEELLADTSELLFRVNGAATLHHSRYCRADRELLDRAVEARFAKGGSRAPGVLVATQTLEQSLDVDFDVLIADLCPVDVLLQRIGRLQRHRDNDARRPACCRRAVCHVIAPAGEDPDVFLRPEVRKGLNAGNDRSAYGDLRSLKLTWDLVREAVAAERPWRIPDDNRRLVESATHPERLQACHDLGPEWRKRGMNLDGRLIGERQQAALALIDWDKPFSPDSAGVVDEIKLSTRLGLDDRVCLFPPGVTGPFGVALDRLVIPNWFVDSAAPDEQPQDITIQSDRIRFSFAGQPCVYTRHGLDKEDS